MSIAFRKETHIRVDNPAFLCYLYAVITSRRRNRGLLASKLQNILAENEKETATDSGSYRPDPGMQPVFVRPSEKYRISHFVLAISFFL